jgi:hypothetical protein
MIKLAARRQKKLRYQRMLNEASFRSKFPLRMAMLNNY